MASASARIVIGVSITILPFRGAAVFVPFRCMRLLRSEEPADSSSSPRLPVDDRLRFNCRCSRPPSVARPGRSSLSAPAVRPAAPRRGRSLPLGSSSGPNTPGPAAGEPGRKGPFLAAKSSRFFFSSCLRMCSESGLVPALLARMASGGRRMSGFCGTGSRGLERGVVFDGAGIGAMWIVGPVFSAGFLSPGIFTDCLLSWPRLPNRRSSGRGIDGAGRCGARGCCGPAGSRDFTAGEAGFS